MRETVIWCDKHNAEGTKEPGREVRLGSENKWYTIDLCDECISDYLNPLTTFLAEYGVKEVSGMTRPQVMPMRPPAKRQQPTPQPAPEPEHVAGQLDFAQAAAEEVAAPAPKPATPKPAKSASTPPSPGGQCWVPGCGEHVLNLTRHMREVHRLDRRVLFTQCPICEQENKLGAIHAKKAHEATIDENYRKAMEAGDPNGFVKAALDMARLDA